MLNKKTLKNNRSLSTNISELEGRLPNSSILVVKNYIPELKDPVDNYFVNDFFNTIICENVEAAKSVRNPDFIIFNQDSAYKDNVLNIKELEEFSSSLIVTNYYAIQNCIKLMLNLNIYNINFLPTALDNPEKTPVKVREVNCGLSEQYPGVHLALILGATKVFYAGHNVTLEELIKHMTPKNNSLPTNIVVPRRKSFVEVFM